LNTSASNNQTSNAAEVSSVQIGCKQPRYEEEKGYGTGHKEAHKSAVENQKAYHSQQQQVANAYIDTWNGNVSGTET